MEINSINPNISSLNNTQGQHVTQTSSSQNVNEKEDASKLVLSQAFTLQKSELSDQLKTINDDIALTKQIDTKLEQQNEWLNKIQANLDRVGSNEVFSKAENSLVETSESLPTYSFIQDNSTTVSFNSSDKVISLENPFLGQIANEVATLAGTTNLQGGDVGTLLKKVEEAQLQNSSITQDLVSIQNELQQKAKESINQEVVKQRTNSSLTNFDFGKDMADSSQNNIFAQLPNLVSTQANASPDHIKRLLT